MFSTDVFGGTVTRTCFAKDRASSTPGSSNASSANWLTTVDFTTCASVSRFRLEDVRPPWTAPSSPVDCTMTAAEEL